MLSLVGLLLAFASTIVTVVSDVRAVNKSQHEPNSNNGTCGYVGCARVLWYLPSCVRVMLTRRLFSEVAPFPISQQVSSGRSSITFSSSSSSSSSSYPRCPGRCPSSIAFSPCSVRNLALARSGSSRDCTSVFFLLFAMLVVRN